MSVVGATTVWTVRAPHFDAGVIVRNGICINAAPILGYMRGWGIGRIRMYCERKSWLLIE